MDTSLDKLVDGCLDVLLHLPDVVERLLHPLHLLDVLLHQLSLEAWIRDEDDFLGHSEHALDVPEVRTRSARHNGQACGTESRVAWLSVEDGWQLLHVGELGRQRKVRSGAIVSHGFERFTGRCHQ